MTDTSAGTRPQPRTLAAVLWMGGALVSFVMVAIAGREASKGVDTLQLMFWRALIGSAILLLIAGLMRRSPREMISAQNGLQVLRNLVHFCGQFSWLYALTLMPLAQLFAIEFTAPLWVAFLAPLLLGERLTATRIGAAFLGFVGVLIVVRPFGTGLSAGAPWAIVAAVAFALSIIATKRLTRTDGAFTILLYMHLLQTVIGLVGMMRDVPAPTAPATWFWISMVAVAGLTAHFSLTRAIALADAVVVAPMDFLRLPIIAVVGAAIYAEPLNPWVLVGGGIVVAANLINITAERRARR